MFHIKLRLNFILIKIIHFTESGSGGDSKTSGAGGTSGSGATSADKSKEYVLFTRNSLDLLSSKWLIIISAYLSLYL